MPKYFFNTVDGRRYPDDEGVELPDLDAVRGRATRVVGELLKERAADFWDTGRLRLEVTDDGGTIVLALDVVLTCQNAA